MVVLSAAAAGRRRCGWAGSWSPRFGAWSATLIAAAAYVVAVAIVMLVLPTIDETPRPIVDDAGMIVSPASRR